MSRSWGCDRVDAIVATSKGEEREGRLVEPAFS
jgi:hypothetical protein